MMPPRVHVVLGLLTTVFLSACQTAQRVGAGAALPFAAIGDTLVLPVQGLAAASDELLKLGAAHRARMHEENRGKVTEDAAAASALVYEFPGYLFYPCKLIAPEEPYPMTRACWAIFHPAPTNRPAPTIPTSPSESFEEW